MKFHLVMNLYGVFCQKEKAITEMKAMEGRSEAEIERDDEHLVTVQELIDSVRKLQSTPDSSKLERISEVSCLF